jgi:large subunit ribosomal protein L14
MIQVGTILNVIDNSGARKVRCIKVLFGYQRRYAFLGDLILVSVYSIRKKRKASSKTKKGELHKALVVRTKSGLNGLSGEKVKFLENSVVLIGKQNRFIGTRVLGSLPIHFRYTKFLRVLSIANGIIK